MTTNKRTKRVQPILLHKLTKGLDHAVINVKDICPDRPLPEWIGKLDNGRCPTQSLVRIWLSKLLDV